MEKTIFYQAPAFDGSGTLCIVYLDGNFENVPINKTLLIGRSFPESVCDLQLSSAIVSRRHGEIRLLEDGFYYTDLDSTNGTFVNNMLYGKKGSRKTCKLTDFSVIRIDQKNLNHTHPQAVMMLFLPEQKDRTWHRIPITDQTGNIEIGRQADAASGPALSDKMLSRRHAVFLRGVRGWSVADCNSTNGVELNSHKIDHAMPLHRLDVIRLAGCIFIYLGDCFLYSEPERPAQPELPKTTAQPAYSEGQSRPAQPELPKTPAQSVQSEGESRNAQPTQPEAPAHPEEKETPPGRLQIYIKERSVRNFLKKKILLQDIRLSIDPGEMVLVLGGSGAGKTTFFNAVMGYEKAEGKILQGDIDIYRDYEKVKHRIGYVPQQDLMREDDVVYDTLENAAEMRLPHTVSQEEREGKINSTLELLGLQKEKESLVRKLSGGQKKRLSIAMELIADPTLFFLDEPDSGLDGIMARSLVENLRVIADEGRIVLVITHSPDRVADLFDKIIVLAKSIRTGSGQLAFYGSIPQALRFFETETLEGIVRRINRKDEGGEGLSDEYIRRFAEYKEGGENV